jgi:ferrous iron transport protein A
MTNVKRLSEMKKGQSGIVQKVENQPFQLVLMEMGFLPNTPIHIEMIAPLGDPMAIKVDAYTLSIRKSEAQTIWVIIQ